MSSGRPLARLIALFLLPLLFFAEMGQAGALFFCAYGEMAQSRCCCPDAHEPSLHGPANIAATCCCEIRSAPRIPSTPPVTTGGPESSRALAVAALVSGVFEEFPILPPPRCSLINKPRPPPGPELLLKKHSLLI